MTALERLLKAVEDEHSEVLAQLRARDDRIEQLEKGKASSSQVIMTTWRPDLAMTVAQGRVAAGGSGGDEEPPDMVVTMGQGLVRAG